MMTWNRFVLMMNLYLMGVWTGGMLHFINKESLVWLLIINGTSTFLCGLNEYLTDHED